ncbi:MAG TPA: 4Fe-4S dicluster domain-containing protein [Terriglobales bacterium]|nr:4Fe-4S dicluster domain-containing protein [Terriglobales bacterium]
MRYGFVIDQDRCIGCHACTVACKEENQVPVGVFRTWVKYVEKGVFPNTRRHFGVLRCNHCDDAPCVEICPTRALYRRSDGIVDFDGNRCIGCKSCMQACPYDALYIDPNSNTAAKCNYCAHRVEVNLEPACVIVCPTRAIIPGDLDNPASLISQIVATEKVSVRKPQKGTEPKLFYKGVEGDLLQPTRLQQQANYFWSDRQESDNQILAASGIGNPANNEPRGHDWAGNSTREIYDVAHGMPWGWRISAYLWTKSIAAGALFVPAFLLRWFPFSPLMTVLMPAIALAALAVTMLLLITDLKRPDRFFYLLTKPNFKSWLVLGSYILMGYGALVALWLLEGLTGGTVSDVVCWLAIVFGIGSACYSAFLFAQAKGRDLWQSQMFFWHLLVHAVIAGDAVLMLTAIWTRSSRAVALFGSAVLGIFCIISLAMILAEISLPHVSEDVALAIGSLTSGALSGRFWLLAIGLGLVLPIVLTALAWSRIVPPGVIGIAAAFALAGVWWFEDLWVKAGQIVPLS